jgi:integrase
MLTEKRIAKLKTKRGRYSAGEVKGLYLQVTKTGVTSWLLRYEIAGRERSMGLGPYPLFKLKEARERARAARKLIADGIDPLEAKAQAKQAAALEKAKTVTFKQVAQEYYDATKSSWRSARTGAQFQSSLKAYVLPVIGSLPVSEIDKALVLKVIRPEWDTKTETMDRVRKRIESVIDFAVVSGYRQPGLNPATWSGFLEHVLSARQKVQPTVHLPALPYQEVPTFMAALRQCEGVAARALEFTILCCVRTGATLAAKWEQIDLDARMWTFAVIKGGKQREHRTPLCNRAIEILKALPHDGNLVFADMSEKAMRNVLKAMGRDDVTTHGFRSGFRDWGAETETGYPSEMFELQLAHKVGSATELAYRRGDQLQKRHRLVRDWEAFCVSSAGVVPLGKTDKRKSPLPA